MAVKTGHLMHSCNVPSYEISPVFHLVISSTTALPDFLGNKI